MEGQAAITTSYARRPVWQWVVIYAVVAAVVYGGVYFFLNRGKYMYQASASSGAAVAQKQLFKDSANYANSYQIFPGALTAQAKAAMNGFMTQTQTMADGSAQVAMTATNPEYKNQLYVVKPGYSLYFVEKNSGDDAVSTNTDKFPGDDTAVLVDPQGYVAN
jgi:hypothetical protein